MQITVSEKFQNNIIARNAAIRAAHATGRDTKTIASQMVATGRYTRSLEEKCAVVERVLGLSS